MEFFDKYKLFLIAGLYINVLSFFFLIDFGLTFQSVSDEKPSLDI